MFSFDTDDIIVLADDTSANCTDIKESDTDSIFITQVYVNYLKKFKGSSHRN